MEALRAEGNALFTSKQYALAIEKYTQGLELCVDDASLKEIASQRVLLWSNRAACYLQLHQYQDAVADCTHALEVDPMNEKARYRRAQAYAALNNSTAAFIDVRQVLQSNPANKAAITLARTIKDRAQSDVHGFQHALDVIVEGTRDRMESQVEKTTQALQYLEQKCISDLSSLPHQIVDKNGITILWNAVNSILDSESRTDADLTILAHVMSLLSILASASFTLAQQVISNHHQPLQAILLWLHQHIQQEYEDTLKISVSTRVAKFSLKLAAFLLEFLFSTTDPNGLIRTLVEGLLNGLRSPTLELEMASLDGFLHLITRTKNKLLFTTLAHEKGFFGLLQTTASKVLEVERTSSVTDPLIDTILSRLPLVFTQSLAPFEKNETMLQSIVREQCVVPVVHITSSADRLAVASATSSCLLVSALFLSNPKLALWAVQTASGESTRFLSRLSTFLVTSRSYTDRRIHTRRLQAIWMDTIASVCSVEHGTSCVPSALRQEVYKMLHASLEKEDLVLRASALSIQLKLSVVDKLFDSKTPLDDIARGLVTQVMDVLAQTHEYQTSNASIPISIRTSPKERAIEALSYIITSTFVKNTFIQNPLALQAVCSIPPSTMNTTVFYGITYIIHHTVTREATLKKKQMEGMEMTPEQYEELQKALKQQSALDDGDSSEQNEQRILKIVRTTSVLTLLVQILKGSYSQAVTEMAIQSSMEIATIPSMRGQLVQSGVFQALIPLSMTSSTNTKSLSTVLAAHTMAKILISTNPQLLSTASVLSSIKPLLNLCKQDHQLIQFETLLALTNIASLSAETKHRIVIEPQGLSTLQYLQFSDHPMVQRAATETIGNLLPHEQVIEKVFGSKEKLKLWLAFARDDESFELARAAGGALAMVSQDPTVGWLMIEMDSINVFGGILETSKSEEILHRALFGLETLLNLAMLTREIEEEEQKRLAVLAQFTQSHKKWMKCIQEICTGSYQPSTQAAAQSCAGTFIQCQKKIKE